MSTHRLLERARHAAEIPLRTAHVERQARQLGDCCCGVSLLLHYAGPGASGDWLGCEDALFRSLVEGMWAGQCSPQESVAMGRS